MNYTADCTRELDPHTPGSGFVAAVARAFLARPVHERGCERPWRILRDYNLDRLAELRREVEVVFTAENPYGTAEQMQREVAATGVLRVYTGHSEHPVWTPEENWAFRAVHDYDTHIAHGLPFSLSGEVRAMEAHLRTLPELCWPAIFTEIVGHAAVFFHTGDYPPRQKAAFLHGFDMARIGRYDRLAYTRNFA
jgi:hypothetical protein